MAAESDRRPDHSVRNVEELRGSAAQINYRPDASEFRCDELKEVAKGRAGGAPQLSPPLAAPYFARALEELALAGHYQQFLDWGELI